MKLLIIFVGLLLITLVFALPNQADNRIDFTYPEPAVNYSLIPTVNATEWWITTEGDLNDVSDILHSDLSNLLWSVAGHTIDTDVDFFGNNLFNVWNIQGDGTGSYFNQSLLITGDSPVNDDSDAGLWIRAEVNYDACINLTESDIEGIKICYDGSGSGIFELRDYSDGTLYMSIDNRDSGNITFYNDTNFYTVNIETLNITGDLNGSNLYLLENITLGGFINGVNISNLSNQFTYYSDEDWINKLNGNNFTFNETKLSTTYYNATQSVAIAGTIDGGTLVQTQHPDGNYDGKTFNFSEEAGSPGLD